MRKRFQKEKKEEEEVISINFHAISKKCAQFRKRKYMVQLKQLCFKILAFSVVVDPNQVIRFSKKKSVPYC